MTKVCSPPSVNQCAVCYRLCVGFCPSGINVAAGLIPGANLWLWVMDKFGNFYQNAIIVNGDGSFDIVLNDFPTGMFSPAAGVTNIFVTTDQAGIDLVEMTFAGATYNCIILQILPNVEFVQTPTEPFVAGNGSCDPPHFLVLWGQITGNILDQTDLINYITTHTGTSTSVSFNAQENILAFQAVTSDGKLGNSNLIQQKNKIIGIAQSNVNTGFVGNATGFGTIQNPSWNWTIGDKIFLNGTSLSSTAPSTGFSILLATATKTDTIDVIIQPSILL